MIGSFAVADDSKCEKLWNCSLSWEVVATLSTKFLVWNFIVQARFRRLHHYWTAISMGGYADNRSQQLPG